MDGESSEVFTTDLALTGMQPDPEIDPEFGGSSNDRLGAPDGPGRAVEGDQETVSGGLDLPSPKPPDLFPDEAIVGIEQCTPPVIPESRRLLRRPYDVGEQHRGEHSFDLHNWLLSG
jgi:hypothetical protein